MLGSAVSDVSPDTAARSADFPVVGIGASAGGLDACRKLLDALPDSTGMAFIIVQHLDPSHESMMVELLASHTAMTVQQATNGMPLARDQVYVIPPGRYLHVSNGALHLSEPKAHHGTRLPFDFLLHSMAESCGSKAICVVLSGTGSDGSLGLRHVHAKGGLVIAQEPEEAGYDGMPRSAIQTGAVDLVLPIAEIAGAVAHYDQRTSKVRSADQLQPKKVPPDGLSGIVELLRTKTSHDFTLYKQGTLQRRIERRMGLAMIASSDMAVYLDILRTDPNELDLLAKDLLINVTRFFRDPKVFATLAETVIPQIVRDHGSDQPLRIWVAGCSTGEEAYSLAMLFLEAITAERLNIKLQVFASDVDADAVAAAREAIYPETIAADISAERLARYFTHEDHYYRVVPTLRSTVIFTVQDVLSDPPFSRLDLVSCRNLLIYLGSEAQAKVIGLFHFALRPGGVLLLGSAENVGNIDGRFELISKPDRLYRHIGRSHPGELGFSKTVGDTIRLPSRTGPSPPPSRQVVFANLCQQLVLQSFAPAAVLINRKHECLYSLGPTDRYLRVATGHPTHDVLAMASRGLRTKLRSAILQCNQDNKAVVVSASHTSSKSPHSNFNIEVRSVLSEGEELLLICFVDLPESAPVAGLSGNPSHGLRVADLERELELTRNELQGAVHNLEISGEEQRAINEEALSVNEEFQSTNEELLTSKEELQSLNEELTALNNQLQETLERQRTTSNDLQNVLYSTDMATIFLDKHLSIRFFTPATKSLFSVIPADVGRPLADLRSLATDLYLPEDALSVLKNHHPIEREIESQTGIWYMRRVQPYRTHEGVVDGVVITFYDITDAKHIGTALEAAKLKAELADLAKSRFLAAASHDLRQPLQSLALLQGLLAKVVVGEKAEKFVRRLDETVSAMSGMLNTLLDINQIDSGVIRVEKQRFPVNDLLNMLSGEFAVQAQSRKIDFRVVPCEMLIDSDPRLLEQMVRNLVSNALKYTMSGKVLVGCRRFASGLSLQICDTGIGIAEPELASIFQEYHQINNDARQRSQGLGLGLSIVKRLCDLLGHSVQVQSQLGKGSVFAINVGPCTEKASEQHPRIAVAATIKVPAHRTGTILVIEDDPDVRDLLTLFLESDGHRVVTAINGEAALAVMFADAVHIDAILTDYNLPNDMNGLQVTEQLRKALQRQIPAIILTGDISTTVLRDIASHTCVQLNKPVTLPRLAQTIGDLLATSEIWLPARPTPAQQKPLIHIVDDEPAVRDAFRMSLEDAGHAVETYADCGAFLQAWQPGDQSCLLIDAYLPGMSGLELLEKLNADGLHLPAIMITGNSDVPMAVQAMKAGACDFIEKPVSIQDLLASVDRALDQARDTYQRTAWQESAAASIALLTRRQKQIMDLVLAGEPSKNIAADLGISQRTVENHRAQIMTKTETKSLPALARLALAASKRAVLG
jgi:two-component system, chemotaxis family, CheB/CheR fusion protein